MRLKILMGYALLALMLVAATWMICTSTRSLGELNRASETLVERRDVVDSLLCSMLATANAERAILLGDASEWPQFDGAVTTSVRKARRLRQLLPDTVMRQRLDSLMSLLDAKRANTLLVMDEIERDRDDAYYENKVNDLRSGRDSVVIHTHSAEQRERQETVYAIVKNRRGFFRRLGDAFRRQHTDTVGMTHIIHTATGDSMPHSVDIADSVASALAQIRRDERHAGNRRLRAIAGRNHRLQAVSVLIAGRTSALLEDIQRGEHTALRQAIDHAIGSRQKTVARIAAFGLLAIASAAVLLWWVLRDIRRERRDRQRIVEAQAETERVMRQRERLLLTITHDIKAPAASIAGFADLLEQYIDRSRPRAYLDNIASSARHLQQLVSALLDYHQLESGKAEVHCASFSPALLVGDTVDEMQPMALKKRLMLRANISVPRVTTCLSDAFRIKQILTNLIGNALKYTDSGGVTVTLDMSVGHIMLGVADTGRGMTEAEQQHIFDAFTRLPGASGREGTGLGLSITRELTRLLGGQISVSSSKGRGSKFMVNIPVKICRQKASDKACDATASVHTGTAVGDEHAAAAQCRRLKVVVVDDDRLQLQLIHELLDNLEGASFDIRLTESARRAVDMIGRDRPHLLFTDIEMPEMGGTDMLRLVAGGGMHTVAMTAHEASIMPQLRAEGFDAYLFKPFSAQALAATICQLTGVCVRPKDMGALGRLLEFADGDKEAERQIKDSLLLSVDEYAALLTDPDDCANVSRAAHKAMPLLEMLHPGSNDWLRAITPECINGTAPSCRHDAVRRLADELARIRTMCV